jgi:osmotically-inducible protein OsmY
MYENNRDGFGQRKDNERNDDPGRRWRRGEERYRREAQGSVYSSQDNRFDDEDYDRDRPRDFGYGSAYRDDDYGGRSAYRNDWRDQRGYALRDYYAARDYDRQRDDGRQVHWHEHDQERRSGHPYKGTYGGSGDSRWFTGQQGSWAVGAPQVPSTFYGTTQYGADYRRHGYDADRDERRGFWDRAGDEVASWFGDEDAARRREQDHRGRGPKDYTRSDERIREDANDRLTDDWRVDASNVTITVKDAEVTLDGTVASREAKRRAEDVVDNVSGVKHVQNNLRVQDMSGTAYTGNWATNRTSTAEGGVLTEPQSETEAKTTKI